MTQSITFLMKIEFNKFAGAVAFLPPSQIAGQDFNISTQPCTAAPRTHLQAQQNTGITEAT
ncbi:MAG: hypothetical protein Q3976_09075 [Corynebacterium sp.]|nr:hypothetical protein [Corynebacterium sp.]